MTMTSKKQADGTYVLNGQKTWVTNGADVPYYIVICKDEEPARENNKMSLWLVKRETEGVSTAHLTKLGQHTVPFVDVFFDNVVVEESQRIGEAGAGWLLLMKNYCVWKLDQGQSINADIAMLKSWGTRAHLQIADNAIEVYGGLGYTEEVRVGRIWRDLRGNMLAGGTCEVMDYIAGRAIPKLYK